MSKRLFLIDGNSLINRAFYALPPLTNQAGQPTNAVYGLTRMLFRLQDDYKPDQIVVTFDVSGPTFRHEQYKEYKAGRRPMPDDLRLQIPVMKDILDALGIARLELEGYEADDLLGTVSLQGEEAGFAVFIVTGDRDCFQLISDKTVVLYTKRGITETELVDKKTLLKEYGVTPAQVVDLKGLMGDSSDNIPGVPGVGEKTALRLLDSYGSMEQVYERVEEIGGKLRERLRENKEQAQLSRELATIKRDVPIKADFAAQRAAEPGQARQLFLDLGFQTLLARVPADGETRVAAAEWECGYSKVSEGNFARFKEDLALKDRVYLITFPQAQMLACLGGEEGWLVPYDLVRNKRQELLLVLSNKKIYCSASKDLIHLLEPAEKQLKIALDLELALYCLNPETRWDFNTLGAHLQLPALPFAADDPKFMACSLRLLQKAAPLLRQELKEQGLYALYQDVEVPLAAVLAAMEQRGILVDPRRLQDISADLEQVLAKLTESIHSQAGEKFNINSPKQLGVVLFEKMGLPVLKRTKTGPSTAADVLEELIEYPIVSEVLEFRQVAKLKSTYADALPELISPATGRIHTTFNQTVTATGRLSSTHPNLQNIPVRTAEGRRIREAFIAPQGFVLLSADYSQIELRLLAHLSQDEVLLQAFRQGVDIHLRTAAEVFELELEQVTPAQRSAAKAINFGIVYGISSFGLAKGINLTRAEAQAYIDSYFERYPKVKGYLDSSVEAGRKQGYVTTLLQRRRYLPGLKSRNYAARNFAARTAMNSPIQGSAADIIKLAMIDVQRALQTGGHGAKLLLQVHDELVFEVPEKELQTVAAVVKRKMENVLELDVPLVVDLSYGPNWRDVQRLELKELD